MLGDAERVTLRDGAEILVRPVRPEDKPLFLAGWRRFGEESRYKRFLGHKPRLSAADLETLTEIDHADHEAIGATDPATGEGIGVARYVRLAGRPAAAEAAVAVVDAWQGRGVGEALLDKLVERAVAAGIETFTASLFTENEAMLALFRGIGEVRERARERGVLEIDVELDAADRSTLRLALRTAASGGVLLGGRDPGDASWVAGAEGSGFGLANLPYGVVAPPGEGPRCAVRIGAHALDLDALQRAGLLPGLPAGVFAGPVLNPFLALGPEAWRRTRRRVAELLAPDAPERPAAEPALLALDDAEVRLPVAVGDYVDFYASLEHATNLGRRFRPGAEPLLANWRHLPVGYHGRAGSIVVSGTPVRRPRGQRPPAEPGAPPGFGPTEQLDLELELGFVIGRGSPLGSAVPAAAAAEHVFGVVLVNDWSARDVQRWEYQPLGPFLGKSFATTLSPWVVPLAALEPHLVPAPAQDPEPLPYLRAAGAWALDLGLEIELDGEVVSRTNARGLYWTFPQLLAHATVNGAGTRPGDLLASGTISGPRPGSEGSLIERFGGERFLADGETAVLRGRAGGGRLPVVSLGEARGTVLPAA